jgi:hypothetical protein
MRDKVRIGKQVEYKTLETALVKAAEEVGWKAQVKDEFERNYHYQLGSVQETLDYSCTMINLRGRVFPAMKVYISNKNSFPNSFFVWQGFPFGVASQKKIQEYLNAVSRNL